MIGSIQGILLEKQPPQLLLDVQGVGYEIDAPMNTFYQLPDTGQVVRLFTHLVVREDAHQLFGFYTRDERSLFRILLKVNGVGPRLALTILSSATPDEFVRCVLSNDTATLVQLPGIGKKTAERLVIEMRDKLSTLVDTLSVATASTNTGASSIPANEPHTRRHILQDAISALVVLGYKQQEANRMIAKVDDGTLGSEELIRRALREVA